jgi:hypothetical protein
MRIDIAFYFYPLGLKPSPSGDPFRIRPPVVEGNYARLPTKFAHHF